MFSWFEKKIVKEDIHFFLSSSSRYIEWRGNDISELEQYVDQIDTSLYKDFTVNKKIKYSFIYTLGDDIRDTCNEMHIE